MSQIKKWLPVLIVIIAIISIAFTACSNQKEMRQEKSEVKASETVAAAKETAAESKISGETFENTKFTILVPNGWVITSSDDISVWIEAPGKASVLVSVSGEDDATEAGIKAFLEEAFILTSESSAPIERVSALGIKFFTTNGISEDNPENSLPADLRVFTVYVGERNGERVSIVLFGKNSMSESKAVMESIKFK